MHQTLIRNAFANSGQVGVNSNYLVAARADSAKAGGDRGGANIIYNLRAQEVAQARQTATAASAAMNAAPPIISRAAPPSVSGGGSMDGGGFRPPSPPHFLPANAGAGDSNPKRPTLGSSSAGDGSGSSTKGTSSSYLGRPPSPVVFAPGGVGSKGEIVHGLGKPFRAENPSYPADKRIVNEMNKIPIKDNTLDCSEITDRLNKFNDYSGSKLRITPSVKFGSVYVPERKGGVVKSEKYDYHFVYYNKGYIYDPRLSSSAIPSGDYFKLVKQYNPEGFVLEEELLNNHRGIKYRGLKP